MAKRIIVARLTSNGEEFVGKREVELYDGSDKKTEHANVGLVLEAQRQIRDALKAKHGLKKVSSGGKTVDYSDIDEV